MKIYFALLLFFLPFLLVAQDKLNFDKKFIQVENKWIALRADTSGVHPYGFVYVDPTAGLTLEYVGRFKIDANGKYINAKRDGNSSMKYRLQPSNNLAALIPNAKLKELEVEEQPEWLKFYKIDEQSTGYLYNRGFMNNAWGDCKSALQLLEKAYKQEPDFKGLRNEMAYSYNCLERYKDAIAILEIAAQKEPQHAYINKELIYANVKSGALDNAVSLYNDFIAKSKDKRYDAENAYNILSGYFFKKDKQNFNKWLTVTQLQNDKRFEKLIAQMKSELK